MSREFWAGLRHAFSRTAVPLGAYYAVTLALPLANGAARSGAIFAKHALVVLVVPPVAIVVAFAGHAIARACRGPSNAPGQAYLAAIFRFAK
jgi:hypothetical protein